MHTTVRYNMATTDATIDRVEFSDVIAPYVYAFCLNLVCHGYLARLSSKACYSLTAVDGILIFYQN